MPRSKVAKVGGPALAGLLIASFGLPSVYMLEAVLFSCGLAAVTRLPSLLPVGHRSGVTLGSLVDGIRFVRRTDVVLSLFLIDFSAMSFGLPVALFPVIAADVFDGGPEVLGLLVAAPAVGAVVEHWPVVGWGASNGRAVELSWQSSFGRQRSLHLA
ncbi:MAG: MFS transporter [Acidimicrobiia bacterium]|nr:MFS transporter [Acidimicrobiia bacterium]